MLMICERTGVREVEEKNRRKSGAYTKYVSILRRFFSSNYPPMDVRRKGADLLQRVLLDNTTLFDNKEVDDGFIMGNFISRHGDYFGYICVWRDCYCDVIFY